MCLIIVITSFLRIFLLWSNLVCLTQINWKRSEKEFARFHLSSLHAEDEASRCDAMNQLTRREEVILTVRYFFSWTTTHCDRTLHYVCYDCAKEIPRQLVTAFVRRPKLSHANRESRKLQRRSRCATDYRNVCKQSVETIIRKKFHHQTKWVIVWDFCCFNVFLLAKQNNRLRLTKLFPRSKLQTRSYYPGFTCALANFELLIAIE